MVEVKEYCYHKETAAAVCDEIAALVEAFTLELTKDQKEALRYRLTVEECLLSWFENAAEGVRICYSYGKNLFRPAFFSLSFQGAVSNPYVNEKRETLGSFGESVLKTLGIAPSFSYRNGENVLAFTVKKKERSPLGQLLLVVAASILVGGLGLLLIPDNALSFMQESVITPVYDTFFTILNCIAGPMIFLSVSWGVYGIGDAATLSWVGKKMLFSYVRNVFLVAMVGVFAFPLFGLHISGGGQTQSQLSGIVGMILGFFPKNIFSPFVDGNTMQIIFIAFVVGIALLFLGKQTESVARAIEQINYLLQFVMGLVSKMVPYFVFVVIVSLFWSGSLSVLALSWKLYAILLSGFTLVILGFYTVTAVKQKVSVGLLLKKCFPTLLIALTTASSAATFHTNIEICEKKLGVSNSVSSFGVPLSMVINKPFTALNNLLCAFFFAQYYSVDCSLMWIVAAVITCAVLAVATPPIPGGGTAAYTMLFLQLGIPMEALALVLALDMVTDFFMTSADMFCLLPSITNVASKIGMLDYEILRSKHNVK